MQFLRPHPSAQCEGWYHKFLLPSGSALVVVISLVRSASSQSPLESPPYIFSLTYVPSPSRLSIAGSQMRKSKVDELELYQSEYRPTSIRTSTGAQTAAGANGGFTLFARGIGSWTVAADGAENSFAVSTGEFEFHATTFGRRAWSRSMWWATPASWFALFPLPLQWHVHSVRSEAKFTLAFPADPSLLPKEDREGTALLHQEKNWGNSFPSAHVWMQACATDGEKSFCAAGGKTMGLQAFILGFRHPSLVCDEGELDFRPPWTLQLGGWGPTMQVEVDWESRRVRMEVSSWTRKMRATAQASPGTFFSLSAPFADGHRENALSQSFQATLEVEVWHWGRGKGWTATCSETFQNASLEFGEDWYPLAGTQKKRN